MAIDIRAEVTCTMAGAPVTLISASISDDYIQGNGLVKYKGSCEISGIATPAMGDVVTFAYTKDGVTRDVPRTLRVLSSFTDPFRRTTKVELGCKLTYLSDLRVPQETLGAICDPANGSYTQADTAFISLPISASSVMAQCLTELGITASSDPLTNKFSIAEFDFSPGYVQVLSDLLVSESYCGYLDKDEVLQIFSLAEEGGTGPVLSKNEIIDLSGIGVGQLPAEAVIVNYSTLRLKQPDPNDPAGDGSPWDSMITTNTYTYPVSYTKANGDQEIKAYNILETSYIYQTYSQLSDDECNPQRVLTQRLTIEYIPAVVPLGGLVTEYLSNGLYFYNPNLRKITTETFTYDELGNEIRYEREVIGQRPFLWGEAPVPWVVNGVGVDVGYTTDFPIEKEIRETTIAGTYRKVETRLYGPWAKTIAGQQNIANARDSFVSAANVASYLDWAYDTATDLLSSVLIPRGMQLIDRKVTTERTFYPQLAPTSADVNNAKYAKGGDPNNGYMTESVAEFEVAIGTETSKRRLELSLPYAPDDTFSKSATGLSGYIYVSNASDAAQKANLYGRVQNMLLLGNRSGMNLQLAPEKLPQAPFAPFVVRANGLSALYRNNGTSYTMDANGIVASTDALFWGAVGGTGSFWFPVAPGVTTLPSEPAVVNGQMTVTTVAPVWNETMILQARTRLTMEVQSLGYALSALTEVPAIRTVVGLVARSQRVVLASAVDVAVEAVAPVISGGASVSVPSSTLTLAAVAPAVVSGASVTVGATDLAVSALVPAEVGGPTTALVAPSVDLALAALAPAVSIGVAVQVGATEIAVAALVPTQVGGPETDPYFANVSLLLHMNTSDLSSTSFVDSSSNAFPVTGNGVIISTAQSKFGGASGQFDGSTSYLTVPDNTAWDFGNGNFTVETWVRFVSNSVTQAIVGQRTSGSSNIAWYFSYSASTGLNFNYSSTGTGLQTRSVAFTPAINTWYHLAVTRSSADLRFFVDGTQQGTTQSAGTTTFFNSTAVLQVGALNTSGRTSYLNGFIDDLRITKGVARYTSNFTVRTDPFPDA